METRLLRLLRSSGHTPARDRTVARFSALGEHAAGWLALGGAGARFDPDPERRRAWARGAGIVLVAYGVNQAIKGLVRRPRPQLDGLPQLTSTMSQLSFPSAHSTTSFAAARAYAGLLPAPMRYGAAGSLALSRLYLGVHWPTDVLAGALLGSAVGEAGARLSGGRPA